jgi:Bifunctional DNA primase/polymerase, N-terminal
MTAGTPCERVALAYAAIPWRVLPLRGKEPLTRHGVKDASSDPQEIVRWFERWPDANVGLATGAPGPQVLDVDDPGALPSSLRTKFGGGPCVASRRGPHFYFAGQRRGTVVLDYGELRGCGSYVVAPPSIHPNTGQEYVWLLSPAGPLPHVPDEIAPSGHRVGAGEHEAPAALVKHGHRHPYLADFTVRLLRAGITDRQRLLAHLRLEFETACVQAPAPQPGYFEQLVGWALESRIADRERSRAEFVARWSTTPKRDVG